MAVKGILVCQPESDSGGMQSRRLGHAKLPADKQKWQPAPQGRLLAMSAATTAGR